MDLAGNPRINGLALDIGAYESVPLLSGDANLDGQVTTADLPAVAGHWQQATTAGRVGGDFNGDGVVTAADLAAVSGNWQDSLTMVVSPIANLVLSEGDPQPELIDLTTVFNNTSVLLYSAESSNTDLITVNIVDDRYWRSLI